MAKITREKFKTYNNVFDQFTLRNLFKLASEGFFEDMKSAIALGKEANIFTAEKEDGSLVIVKIYRLEGCNFNKMFSYIRQDPRYETLSSKKREIIFAWTQREFRNLLKARESIRVPTPYKVKDNIIVMEMIGKVIAAPELKNALPKNPKKFFDKLVDDIRALYEEGLVHGDLSHFNILNSDEEPVMIDFSQATLTRNPESEELLERDIRNIVSFFNSRCKLQENVDDILKKIRKQ
jgi:RIO kinase 1